MTKPKISMITLGCKVNQYDSDAMMSRLVEGGFIVMDGLETADVYIINTCAVTAEAERKSRQIVTKIRKLNEEAKIYVCGCASQNNFSQFAKDGVEFISGTEGKLALADRIISNIASRPAVGNGDNAVISDACEIYSDDDTEERYTKIVAPDFEISNKFEEAGAALSLRTRHYIKIQDGCNNFCSYCIVPYVRGRSRSRSLIGILGEITRAQATAKEVVITGINLSAYGNDIGLSLTSLLIALQNFDVRLRLGSLEVGIINTDFLDSTKSLKAFCPHFHLSLQSGDDSVLKDMNRKYSTADYEKAVELIRQYYPDAAITTDIIVGFPTESDEAFKTSFEFAEKMAFSDIHIFPYSSRKGTVAGRMKTLAPDVVDGRVKEMTALKNKLREKYLLAQLGKPTEVLFETKESGMWCGHSRNYVKVYSLYGTKNTLATVVPTMLFDDGVRV